MTVAWTDQHRAMSYLIDEYCDALVLEKAKTTIDALRRVLRQLHRELPLGVAWATTSQLRGWLANPDWSQNTRHTYGALILGAYRWWHAEGLINPNPAAKIKTPPPVKGRPRPMGEQYVWLLLQQPEPLRTIALLGAFEGMRRAEMAGCHREHISEAEIFIPRAKGGRPQTVPTHPLVWEHVADRAPGPLLLCRDGRPMRAKTLSEHWRRARDRLGLPETLVPHMLRHRFGTEVRRQHDVLVAKKALRHSSLASAEIYTEVGADEVASAIRALPVEHRPATIRPVPPAKAA